MVCMPWGPELLNAALYSRLNGFEIRKNVFCQASNNIEFTYCSIKKSNLTLKFILIILTPYSHFLYDTFIQCKKTDYFPSIKVRADFYLTIFLVDETLVFVNCGFCVFNLNIKHSLHIYIYQDEMNKHQSEAKDPCHICINLPHKKGC